MRAPTRLIIAIPAAIVVVMATFLPALAVVVCALFCLIVQIGTALFVQVLVVLAMDATGLRVLSFVPGGTLPVVAFVVAPAAVVAKLALLASSMLVATVTSIVQPVAPTLVGEKTLLMPILILHLAA